MELFLLRGTSFVESVAVVLSRIVGSRLNPQLQNVPKRLKESTKKSGCVSVAKTAYTFLG